MKALLISDVHANISALEAVWEKEKDADIIYCGGDLVVSGPMPNETIDWIRAHNVQGIMGNHDAEVVDLCDNKLEDIRARGKDLTWAEHNALTLRPDNLEFLRKQPQTLTFELGGHNYFMLHRYHKYEVIRSKHMYSTFLAANAISPGTRLIFGHTHWQCVTRFSDDQILINPGSIGYRHYRDEDDLSTTAEYAVIQNGEIHLRETDYDKTLMRETINRYREFIRLDWYEWMMKKAAQHRPFG